MNSSEILEKAKVLLKSIPPVNNQNANSVYSTIKEFLRVYAGEKSNFYKNCPGPKDYDFSVNYLLAEICKQNLAGFIGYLEQGLQIGPSAERMARIDVVSDFLAQAQSFLENSEIHPAGPAMIVGACLEEFLRNWVEEENLQMPVKPTIDTLSSALRSAELIEKQDVKDITSWGGIRNDAAHGHWENVKDPEKIKLMLLGINLFMRKFSPEIRKNGKEIKNG